MKKWEYLTRDVYRERAFLGTWKDWEGEHFEFNELGQEGWELVHVITSSDEQGDSMAGTTTALEYIFKRPIEDNS